MDNVTSRLVSRHVADIFIRTAEDLTSTQRRLARYEALLNDIMPHVPPNVKAMIEEAKDQVCLPSLNFE